MGRASNWGWGVVWLSKSSIRSFSRPENENPRVRRGGAGSWEGYPLTCPGFGGRGWWEGDFYLPAAGLASALTAGAAASALVSACFSAFFSACFPAL